MKIRQKKRDKNKKDEKLTKRRQKIKKTKN